MMEPKTNDPSGLSQTSMCVMNSVEGRQTVHRRPVGLTITVEMIDRVLADIQAQIEFLWREKTNLGLVRGQLAAMEAKWRGECTTPAYLPNGRAAGLLDLDCEGYATEASTYTA